MAVSCEGREYMGNFSMFLSSFTVNLKLLLKKKKVSKKKTLTLRTAFLAKLFSLLCTTYVCVCLLDCDIKYYKVHVLK